MKHRLLSLLVVAALSASLHAGNPEFTLVSTSEEVGEWRTNLQWATWQSDWSSVDGVYFRVTYMWDAQYGLYQGSNSATIESYPVDPLILNGWTFTTYAPSALSMDAQVYAVRVRTAVEYLYHRPTGDVYKFTLDSGDKIHAWNFEAVSTYTVGPNWNIEWVDNIGSWLSDSMIYQMNTPYFGSYWGDR